jgi:transcriptional regulator with GAF, ATPase, and Fis domain
MNLRGQTAAALEAARRMWGLLPRRAISLLDAPVSRSSNTPSTLRRIDPARGWSLSIALRRLLVSATLEWSGNVRQLERAIERARERAVSRDPEATVITPEHLEARDVDHAPLAPAADALAPSELLGVTWQRLQAQRAKLDEREQDILRQALSQSAGVVAQAARELGIARTTLSSRLDALSIRVTRRSEPIR